MIPLTNIRSFRIFENLPKFHKLILFLDRAPQHCRSKRVKAYLEKNNDVMTAEYFPKGSSELSAVEECWRQGKDNLLVSKYYPRFTNLKAAITNYYRTTGQERVCEFMLVCIAKR
ncbi:MAG: transposase, partial [Candidatus Nitrosopolaris sp.]